MPWRTGISIAQPYKVAIQSYQYLCLIKAEHRDGRLGQNLSSGGGEPPLNLCVPLGSGGPLTAYDERLGGSTSWQVEFLGGIGRQREPQSPVRVCQNYSHGATGMAGEPDSAIRRERLGRMVAFDTHDGVFGQ